MVDEPAGEEEQVFDNKNVIGLLIVGREEIETASELRTGSPRVWGLVSPRR